MSSYLHSSILLKHLCSDPQQLTLQMTFLCFFGCNISSFVISTLHEYALQHLTDCLISHTFKPEDLQCSFFCYVVRELLTCLVMRPVLNLANPRY